MNLKNFFFVNTVSSFQNFVLVKDVLGVTNIDDLCEADVRKVRSLALIELTALFDTNNITYSRRKPKKRLKGNIVIVFYIHFLNVIFSRNTAIMKRFIF